MTSLFNAKRGAMARLAAVGIEGAAQDVAALLAHILAIERGALALIDPQTELSTEQVAAFETAVVARALRQPVSQILGRRWFWGHDFAVTPDVLDPRPDTETLVAAALEVPFTSVLDLGTGSGCILLSLLLERPQAVGQGVDVSGAALNVARLNHRRLAPDAQVGWHQGSWFEPVQGQFDLIVSNPPYIAAGEMAGLAPEVRDWEPHLALTPGGDGLEPYRILAAGALAHLVAGGWLMVEIGPTQGAAVAGFFADSGLQDVSVVPDIDGRDRVVKARA